MSEWWTYSLSDFLLFSPRVYYRLFELHNRALWPAQVLTIALGLAAFFMLLRRGSARGRLVAAIFGVLWLSIAWFFFWERYATINWASPYVAPFYAIEGALLIWFGAIRGKLVFARDRNVRSVVALALLALAVVAYPLIALPMGRPIQAAEVFGVAPDPTAVATLAVLALAQGGLRWPLTIVPLVWCAVTGATLWTTASADFFVAPLGALVAVTLACVRQPAAGKTQPAA